MLPSSLRLLIDKQTRRQDSKKKKVQTWSRFCSSKFGRAELVRAGTYKHENQHNHLNLLNKVKKNV